MWSDYIKTRSKLFSSLSIFSWNIKNNLNYIALYVPTIFKYCYIKNSFFFFYTDVYYILLFYNYNSFNIYNSVICFKGDFNFMFFKYFFFFKKLFLSLTNYFFKKIKFTGKGYRVYKSSRNVIALQFNHSHRNYVYLFTLGFFFLNKYSLIFFDLNFFNFFKKVYMFKQERSINLYTLRGMRFSDQIIFKKIGKVSNY